MVETLIARNRIWSMKVRESDPGYFERLAGLQAPRYFWIGCSDSRVPANVVAGLDPGEVFVHRNVGNVVHSSDMNMLSALEYAVEALGVQRVIVCGHYGCGGVRAATEDETRSLSDHWLAPIRRLAHAHAGDLEAIGDVEAWRDRIAELNVRDGVERIADTPIMRRAWRQGAGLSVHGLIYGLKDGRLRELACAIAGV
jgi:carbonic anhydrase